MLDHSPVRTLAEEHAAVRVTLTLTSDPKLREGEFSDYVVARARVTGVEGRGRSWGLGMPVLVLGDPGWRELELGSSVLARGRLGPADGADLAAVLTASPDPRVLTGPSAAWR